MSRAEIVGVLGTGRLFSPGRDSLYTVDELDQDAADATAAIIDGLGRVFSLEAFAAVGFRAARSDS